VKKRLIAVVFSLVLMLSFSLVPVSAVDVDGSFSVGDAATVTVTFDTGSMTPQVEQTVTVGVDAGSGRTLAELTEVKFKIWYDVDAGTPTIGEFNAVTEAAATAATITWVPSTFTLTEEGGSTWDIGTGTTPTLSNQTGDFLFVIKPGKVATETTTTPKWQLGATATSGEGTGFGYDASPPDMDWFGELSIGGSPTLAWGSVPAGLAFGDGTSSQQALGETITIISNGAYNLTALSSATWTSAGAGPDATLDATGATSSAEQFALKTDEGAVHASATLLASTATTIESGTITAEAGATFTSINVWLKLANSFEVDTYSGTVSFLVANG
jgi:hypothetical protein